MAITANSIPEKESRWVRFKRILASWIWPERCLACNKQLLFEDSDNLCRACDDGY